LNVTRLGKGPAAACAPLAALAWVGFLRIELRSASFCDFRLIPFRNPKVTVGSCRPGMIGQRRTLQSAVAAARQIRT